MMLRFFFEEFYMNICPVNDAKCFKNENLKIGKFFDCR